jgi:hypothetical protein
LRERLALVGRFGCGLRIRCEVYVTFMVPLSYSGTGLGPYGTGGIKVFVDICFITMFDRRLINKVATIAINIMAPGVRSTKIVKPLLMRTIMMIAARYEGWHIT